MEAAKAARIINAFHPDDIPGAQESSVSLEVAALMEMLEELENSAQRSVAAEIESSLESGACLIDDYGRERILEICKKIRNQAAKLSPKEKEIKLQAQFHKAATGQLPKLEVPRSEVPLSLFDWQVWSQARPNLWRYGDGGNLDPKRENYSTERTPHVIIKKYVCFVF